ncbi:GMC family oxidoreductase [Limobrevibacterium gyesilva]|uniref:GMC family oxidoreductase n=1 Tax=Limobrevibacterium gyesilva TaxID=2991712 RepID=A0AA41YJJ6_9PROT|nr:GMC family oxidoreductase [Limobrevibacterium gyesilva]MCW3474899.1 GMC family oxidoreductase [Limobrevibacterium gyesilva]
MAQDLSADIVVIGSGVCGLLAAHRLVMQGASLLILEAGPRVDRGRIVAAYRNSAWKGNWMAPYPSMPWAPHPNYHPKDNGYLIQAGPYPYPAEYIRVVGGTIWHWAAHAWRVLPNDLKIKSLYGVGRDWPLSYEELEPYYYEAEVKMGVSGAPNTGSPRTKPFPMEPVAEPWAMRRFRERLAAGGYEVVSNTTARNSRTYDGRPACCGNNNCQPICPIGAQYDGGVAASAAEAAGAKIIPNAVVYRIEHDPQGRIVAVHYYDPNKTSYRVTGKTFILAANGIESPKLLLMSASDKYPKGLANGSDMVGRNLMDHPSSSLTFDAEEELWLGRGHQSPSSINTFRDGAFRSEYAAFRLDFTNISQVRSAAEDLIAAGVYGPELEKQLRYRSAHQVNVKDVLEVLPNPENRVVLSSQKDALGIPKPEVHYALDDYVHKGMAAAKVEYARIAELMGGTNLRYTPDGQYANNQHITGTMSMGNDPKDSVVDRFGRAHDHPNLFIAGTGVMPTAATVNSTLTGVALALRTAQHIHETS